MLVLGCGEGIPKVSRTGCLHRVPLGESREPSVGPSSHRARHASKLMQRRRRFTSEVVAFAPRSGLSRKMGLDRADARSAHFRWISHRSVSRQSTFEPHFAGSQAKYVGSAILCIAKVKWVGTRERMGFRSPQFSTIALRCRNSGAASQSKGRSNDHASCTS